MWESPTNPWPLSGYNGGKGPSEYCHQGHCAELGGIVRICRWYSRRTPIARADMPARTYRPARPGVLAAAWLRPAGPARKLNEITRALVGPSWRGPRKFPAGFGGCASYPRHGQHQGAGRGRAGCTSPMPGVFVILGYVRCA